MTVHKPVNFDIIDMRQQIDAIDVINITDHTLREAFTRLKGYGIKRLSLSTLESHHEVTAAITLFSGVIEKLHTEKRVAPHIALRYGRLREVILRISLRSLPPVLRDDIYYTIVTYIPFYRE